MDNDTEDCKVPVTITNYVCSYLICHTTKLGNVFQRVLPPGV